MKKISEPTENFLPLYILDILQEYTDQDHRLTLTEIGEKIRLKYDVKPDRKTLRRNIANLAESDVGIDYYVKKKKTPVQQKNPETGRLEKVIDEKTGKPMMETIENWDGYCILRDFETSEIRLLIDGLLFSRNIPRKDCVELAEKLAKLAGPYYKSHVGHISTRPDTMPQNPQIFYNIEMLDEAIHNGKKVEFSYLEYGTDMKQHPRTYKNGNVRRYRVSPYQMAAKNGCYYLICNHEYFDSLANYRVDRMTDVEILEDEPIRPFESLKDSGKGRLDLAKYMAEHIYMFGQQNSTVKFRIRKNRLNDLFDNFGKNISFSEETEEEVTVITSVNEMAMMQFAKNFAPDVMILEPRRMAEDMKNWAEETLKRYQERE